MRRALTLGIGLLLAASPSLAGTVYVPLATDTVRDGVQLKTQLLVTNQGARARRFSAVFLERGIDGTAVSRTGVGGTTVEPLSTVVVEAVPPGGLGILEITTAPQLVVDARLLVTGPDGKTTATQLPVVTSGSLVAAGEGVHLQGLERSPGSVSNLGILNLEHHETSCEVRVFRADGTPLNATAVISFQPLSILQFLDVFRILGLDTIAEAHVEVVCDGAYYAFATVVQQSPAAVQFISPSASGKSDLVPPGQEPDVKVVEFEASGNFFQAVAGDSVRSFDLPLVPGVSYRVINIDFDFFLNRWQSDLFHALVGLARPDGTLYFGMFLRRNGRTILDLDEEQEVKVPGPWQERTQYHVHIRYDTEQGEILIQVLRGVDIVHEIVTPVIHTDLSDNGNPVRLVFGLPRVFDGAFFPPVGWRFSRLKVRVIP